MTVKWRERDSITGSQVLWSHASPWSSSRAGPDPVFT